MKTDFDQTNDSSDMDFSECQTLCSWVDRVPALHLVSVASNLRTDVSIPVLVPGNLRHTSCTCGRHMMQTPCAALPPYIRGRARSTQSHDMVQLECIVVTSNVDLGCVSNSILAKELCQARSVFSFCSDG